MLHLSHLNFLNILLLFCGLIINALYAIQKAKKQDQAFSLGFFIKDNAVLMLLNIIVAFVSLVLAPQLISICGMSVPDGSAFFPLHALISGVVPLYFIDKLLKLYPK